MKTAIIGSRTITDYNQVSTILQKHEITTIVSGGAKGVDTLAEQYADEFHIPKLIFRADWQQHGKAAGYIRNHEIIKNSEVVIAFWDNQSRGTKHSIDLAKKHNKQLYIYNI